MFENLRRDITRYEEIGQWYSNPGFWIVAIFRFGNWADALPNIFLRIPMWLLYRVLRFPFRRYNVHLWAGRSGPRIGAGLLLIHPTNIMIGQGVEIGEDCLIFHGVTLGTGQIPGKPKIGNNVDIYPGACLLGGITIGNRSMIGANCVVTRHVPSESIIVTAPCRIIPRSLSPVAREKDQKISDDSMPAPQQKSDQINEFLL
jgi:serine O-acetyltransferase